MKLTEEQLLENWQRLIAEIEETQTGPRKNQLIELYNKLQPEMMMAPASGFEHFHNCFIGGYVDHVIRVVQCARKLYFTWKDMGLTADDFTHEELMFVAINHDLGKIGDEENESYIPQTDQWRRDKLGEDYMFNKKVPFC